ncbi:MAG: AbrB/MazE/SpoVT family DNA-binding domain-containing protein [Thermoplasmataceae archaeon]|jgi:AbrB family looped-hinge helix DNA binding protein
MSDEIIDTEFTKTSSKGQIVIPSNIRRKLKIGNGSLLAVTTQDDLIVLKKVSSKISPADMKTLKLIEEAWKDLDKGNFKVRSKEDFFKEYREW